MINVSKAICSRTAVKVLLFQELTGHFDSNNLWVEGGFGTGKKVLATPVPVGDRDDGVFGEQLKSLNEGERTPKLMQFTLKTSSKTIVRINDVIEYKGDKYKLFQVSDYEAGGYWQVQGVTAPDVLIGGTT